MKKMNIIDLINELEIINKIGDLEMENNVIKIKRDLIFKGRNIYAIEMLGNKVYIRDMGFNSIKINTLEKDILKSWVKNVLNK